MNDNNNDDFSRKSVRQTAAYRLGYVSVRRLQTKVSEYGGTGKDFIESDVLPLSDTQREGEMSE
jgi:hypothetical protein